MRRWLAIFLMVFMPFQLGWAAVSAYCQHESGAAANHLGHHEHRHPVDHRDAGTKSDLDLDCGFCLAASVAALPSSSGASMSSVIQDALAPPPLPALASAPLAEPERPKWARAA